MEKSTFLLIASVSSFLFILLTEMFPDVIYRYYAIPNVFGKLIDYILDKIMVLVVVFGGIATSSLAGYFIIGAWWGALIGLIAHISLLVILSPLSLGPLGKIRSRRLLRLFDSLGTGVRLAIAKHSEGKHSIELLCHALKDTDIQVSQQAAETLDQLKERWVSFDERIELALTKHREQKRELENLWCNVLKGTDIQARQQAAEMLDRLKRSGVFLYERTELALTEWRAEEQSLKRRARREINQCSLCLKQKDEPLRDYVIYSGEYSEYSTYGPVDAFGFSEVKTTMSRSNFQEHIDSVCNLCRTKHNILIHIMLPLYILMLICSFGESHLLWISVQISFGIFFLILIYGDYHSSRNYDKDYGNLPIAFLILYVLSWLPPRQLALIPVGSSYVYLRGFVLLAMAIPLLKTYVEYGTVNMRLQAIAISERMAQVPLKPVMPSKGGKEYRAWTPKELARFRER